MSALLYNITLKMYITSDILQLLGKKFTKDLCDPSLSEHFRDEYIYRHNYTDIQALLCFFIFTSGQISADDV